MEKVHGGGGVQLTIYPPVAVKTIDTEEILVKAANGRVAYFSGAAWGDRLPRLFQARLVEALANSGAFRAILTNQDRVSGDLSLAIEIRDFEVEASLAEPRPSSTSTSSSWTRKTIPLSPPSASMHSVPAASDDAWSRHPCSEWRFPASSPRDRLLGVPPHRIEMLGIVVQE